MESVNTSPSEYHLIARELAGTATPEERAELQAWVAADPGNARVVDLLHEAWRLSGPAEERSGADVDAGWSQVISRIHGDDLASLDIDGGQERPSEPRGRRSGRWVRLSLRAAAIGGLVLVPWLGREIIRSAPAGDAGAVTVIVAARGEIEEAKLPDGTLVRLGAGSTFQFETAFSGPMRAVDLEGMAQFDVSHDPARPFVVRTGDATTTVLGTRFVVRAYPEVSRVEVAVAEGSVSLRGGRGDQDAVINAGQVGTVSAKESPVVTPAASLDAYFGWTAGVLTIEDRPLKEVLAELERWYDAELEVRDPGLAARLITTTAGDAPLGNVIAGIVLALDARYEQRGDTIVLVP